MEDAKKYVEEKYYPVDSIDELNGEPLAVYESYINGIVSGKNSIRDIILKRIEEIKKHENDFSKSSMEWKSPLSHGTIVMYADEIDFNLLSDEDLIFLFERILKRYYTQM